MTKTESDVLSINGWIVKKLPDHADFRYAVSKGGYEDKFYSLDAATKFCKSALTK